MPLRDDEFAAAGVLAAALISAMGGKIANTSGGPAATAAKLYFDCLEALENERLKRHKAQIGSR